MNKTILFDSNGTLLDMSGMDDIFIELFGEATLRPVWLNRALQTTQALTLIGDYQPFAKIAEQTMLSLASERAIAPTGPQKSAFREQMQALPAFPDVAPGLERLKAAGYRLAVFTNSGRAAARTALAHAGIDRYFDKVLSCDDVRMFKPARESYMAAVEQIEGEVGPAWMVAAHAWDVAGAMRAGLRGALLRRPCHGLNGCFARPDADGANLPALAEAMIAQDTPLLKKVVGLF